MNFREIAYEYVSRNIPIIPLRYKTKDPYFDVLPRDEFGNLTTSPFLDRILTLDELDLLSEHITGKFNIGIVTGAISGRIAFDIDPRKGGDESWRELVGNRQLQTFTVGSGGGGLHVYFEYPGFPCKLKSVLPGIDLMADRRYCVAPPSVHETGEPYKVTNNLPLAKIPEFLADWIIPSEEHVLRPLPTDGQVDLLQALQVFRICERKRQANRQYYPSLSEYDYGVIVTLANQGCNFDIVCAAFEIAKKCHATHFATKKNYRGAIRQLRRSYEKALCQSDSPAFLERKARVCSLANQTREIVEAHIWKGVSGRTDRKVMLAHLQKMEIAAVVDEQNKFVWDVSCREVSEATCTKRDTSAKATNRLINEKWLERVANPSYTAGLSARYRLGEGCSPLGHVHTWSQEKIGRVPFVNTVQTFGVFESRNGLGKTAELIWERLQQGFNTKASLIKSGIAHRVTIQRNLDKLEQYSIVTCINGIYSPTTHYDFEKLARELGTIHAAEIRKRSHDEERLRFKVINEQRKKLRKFQYRRR